MAAGSIQMSEIYNTTVHVCCIIDNKAVVCLNSPTYHISLTGTAQVCTDPETCREMWYEGLSNHFFGPDDPNPCVIRFTTQRYSLFIDWEQVKGEINE